MRRSIWDLLEFFLVEFFVAATGVSLSASIGGTRAAVVVLVATIMLLIIVLIQFVRRLRGA